MCSALPLSLHTFFVVKFPVRGLQVKVILHLFVCAAPVNLLFSNLFRTVSQANLKTHLLSHGCRKLLGTHVCKEDEVNE